MYKIQLGADNLKMLFMRCVCATIVCYCVSVCKSYCVSVCSCVCECVCRYVSLAMAAGNFISISISWTAK